MSDLSVFNFCVRRNISNNGKISQNKFIVQLNYTNDIGLINEFKFIIKNLFEKEVYLSKYDVLCWRVNLTVCQLNLFYDALGLSGENVCLERKK